MSEPDDSPARLRRNGKQQSCEPCRLRKQSCSHEKPCARCVRHSRNCIYVHAPMSRLPKSENNTTRSTSPRNFAPSPAPAPVVLPAAASRKTASRLNPLMLATGGNMGYKSTPGTLTFSHVGSTGYSAIFDEAKGHLGMNIWEDTEGSDNPILAGFLRPRPDGSRPGLAFCRGVLAWLPTRQVSEQVIAWNLREVYISTPHWPITLLWHEQFWAAYGDNLREPRTEKRFNIMAEELVRNTSSPLARRPATNQMWLDSHSGHNTRWEMVGELFLLLGIVVLMMPESDPLLRDILPADLKGKKKSFACIMLECADACLLLCEELDDSNNILTVGLLARCVMLQSMIGGDSSIALWKRCGRLASALTGLGLHLKLENAEQVSPLYHEARVKTYTVAYQMNIGLASFTGRPALLSKRYTTIPLPLDVSNEALLEAESIAELQKTTDSNGWNLAGEIYPATESRVQLISAMERDEILDLTLAQATGDLSGRLRDLRFRMAKVRKQLPALYQLPIDKKAFSERSTLEISGMAQVRLTLLHSEFLVERLEHEEKDEQRLLKIAKEILNLVVTYWSERDRFPSHRDEVHWFISSAGIPAASALAIDLFKQTTSPYLKPPNPYRADTIQDLSLFVACLDWIRPEDGNYVLCGRVRKMIKHILERVLAPASMLSAPASSLQEQEQGFAASEGGGGGGYNLEGISIDSLPQFGFEFGGWLDGIDAAGFGLDWSSSMMQY